MSTSSRNRTLASAFFLASALLLLGVWTILLFVGVPAGQSTSQHAAQLIPFLFKESEHPWFFVLIAVLPLVFLVLATWHWIERRAQHAAPVWIWALTGVAVAFCMLLHWAVLLAACTATYYAYRSNSDA
jgi:hypothetical protein